MEIEFIPLDYDYFDWQGRNYAKIIGRTKEGKRVCIIDSFPPFLWVILKENISDKKIQKLQEKIRKIKIKSGQRETKIQKTEIHEKNFLGKKVKAIKIFITNYKDAHDIADKLDFKEIECRREYDLSYITHYIIESSLIPQTWYKLKGELVEDREFGGISNIDVDFCLKLTKIEQLEKKSEKIFLPKILAFDIETDEFEIGKGEILMISLVGDKLKKVLTWKLTDDKTPKYIEHYKDEADMIEAFVKYVKEYSPDILTGYYSDGFDLPYLRARAEKNRVRLDLGVDGSQPKFSRGRLPTSKISGLIHIDLFRFIETAYSQYLQSETLSLDEVSKEIIGEEKHDFKENKGIKSKKLDEKGWLDYFDYNLKDSDLTYKLFEKLWIDMSEFSKIIQEPVFSITRSGMSQLVELYIIHNLNKFNEIAEKRPIHNEISLRRERGKYEGAFVLQPQPGLYENLASFDFTSMYGSVIVSFNLSKANFSDKKIPDSIEVDVGKKVYFSKRETFFPSIISELIKKRKQYKQEYKSTPNPVLKVRSNAYKLIVNAAYGYLGFFAARYYCPEAAAATAALARKFIKDMIEKTNKAGFKVIYADTDGFSFLLDKKTKKQTIDFLKKLNSQLPGIMELELEDFYKRGLWVTKRTGEFGAKKKYALINHDNKLRIRGFETVRRDWCQLARKLQNKILNLILTEGNEISALNYFKEVIKDLKERKIDKKDILIRTQLKKPLSEYKSISPHVVAARKMIEKNDPVNQGMLIEFFIAETREKTKLVRDKVKLPDEKGEYNLNYYLNNQLIPAVENIFDTFDINLKELTKEIVDGKKQSKLGEF